MTRDAHARQLLDRLDAAELEARETLRMARNALEDLARAVETGRMLRAELAALVMAPDADALPPPEEFARRTLATLAGEVRR
jgi:hypothetical protein